MATETQTRATPCTVHLNLKPTAIALAVAAALMCGPAYAASYTWTGGGSGSNVNIWSAKQNWGASSAPGAGDTVTISGGSNTPKLDTNVSIAVLNYSGVAIGGNLNLNGKVLTISSDYNSSFFGSGNLFNRYANVTIGGGAINAGTAGTNKAPLTFQQLSTDGGTTKTAGATTLDMGNIHVGGSVIKSYSIYNMAGAGGVTLRGAIQGSGLDARLTGTGANTNWSATAAASSGVSNSVTFTGSSAGALSSSQLTILNNFANTNQQVLNITGAAYRYAAANAITTPVNLGNVHVGGTFGTQALSITNNVTNDGYSEKLDAAFGTLAGSASASGLFGTLAAGSTNNSSLIVGLGGSANTGTAGAKTGTAVVSLTSNGSGTSGLGTTALASQTVTVNGGVYRYAAANSITTPVNLGIIHVNGSFGTQAVSVTNTATNDAYSEKLNASIDSVSGAASGSGSVYQLAAGSSGSVTVGLGSASTTVSGARTGTVAVGFVSDGSGTSGLGTTALTGQSVTVNGQVNDYAQAGFANYTGSGSSSGTAAAYVINLGTILQNTGSASGSLNLGNLGGSAAFTDWMDGSFDLTGVTDFTLSGFSSFTNLAGGSLLSPLTVSLNNNNVGSFNQFVTLNWNGHNANYLGGTTSITLQLQGTVASVPESKTWGMLLAGLGLVGFAARRRRENFTL